MAKLMVAIALIGLQLYALRFMRTEPVIPDRTTFAEFPMTADGWRCQGRETIPDDIMEKLQATDYLSCLFEHEAGPAATPALHEDAAEAPTGSDLVHLYIGYHATQTRSGASGRTAAIHPPEHCLPGAGWDVVDARVIPIVIDGEPAEAKRFVIAKGNRRNLVYFWYQSRGRVVAHNHEKIFYTFVDRMLRGRTDGALVRMTVPVHNDDVDAADRKVARFMKAVTPELGPYLPD